MDRWFLLSQNQMAGWGLWSDYVALSFAQFAIIGQGALLLLRWLLPGNRHREDRFVVLLAVGGAVLALGLATIPAEFYYRERPLFALPQVFDLLGGEEQPSPSFPSRDAAALFTVAFIMGWRSLRWALPSGLLAVGNWWARVYAGLHWPSDGLGGIVIALAVSWFLLNLRPELEPALERVEGWLSFRRARQR